MVLFIFPRKEKKGALEVGGGYGPAVENYREAFLFLPQEFTHGLESTLFWDDLTMKMVSPFRRVMFFRAAASLQALSSVSVLAGSCSSLQSLWETSNVCQRRSNKMIVGKPLIQSQPFEQFALFCACSRSKEHIFFKSPPLLLLFEHYLLHVYEGGHAHAMVQLWRATRQSWFSPIPVDIQLKYYI